MKRALVTYLKGLLLATAPVVGSDAHAATIQIVAFGDSNTAGFLVGSRHAFPAVMEASLRAAGYNVRISNAGISGDTTGGMLSRLERAIPGPTKIAIVQGGYNDMRRGVPPAKTDANIETILSRLTARGVKVILCNTFGSRWETLARRYNAVAVPGSACYDVNSRGIDGLHMNRAGHRTVAARLQPILERVLSDL
jgi:acyl-CoA thioesterase I